MKRSRKRLNHYLPPHLYAMLSERIQAQNGNDIFSHAMTLQREFHRYGENICRES